MICKVLRLGLTAINEVRKVLRLGLTAVSVVISQPVSVGSSPGSLVLFMRSHIHLYKCKATL